MSLIIRNRQMQTFENSLRERFAANLAKELREEHPKDVEPYNDEELHDLVLEGIERAEGYELEGDADVTAFVELLFIVGWYFDRYPLFQHYLTEEDYESHERLEYMFDSAEDEDWKEAAKMSNELLVKEEQGKE